MAGKTRTFWIIPGKVDKDGRPVEYPEKPSTFILSGLGLGEKPVQVTEELTDEGEYTQTVDGPDGKPQVISSGIDSKQLALHTARAVTANTTADNARADAANVRADRAEARAEQPPPRTPDQARHDAAAATVAEAQARAAANPATIRTGRTVPIGPEGQEGPELVSKDQADFDRQAARDLQSKAEAAQKQAYDNAMLGITREKWTAEQAATEYNKSLDKIRLDLQQQTLALTRRGQDISARGQDISAGVSQRGQDMGYEQAAGQDASANWRAVLPFLNAPGQVESTNSLMAGGPPVPTKPVGLPFNPSTVGLDAAMAARAQMPGQYVLPGVPGAPPPGPMTLPG